MIVWLTVPPPQMLPVIVMEIGVELAKVFGPRRTSIRLNGPDETVSVNLRVLDSANPNQSETLPIMERSVWAESNTADSESVGVIVKPSSVYGEDGGYIRKTPGGSKAFKIDDNSCLHLPRRCDQNRHACHQQLNHPHHLDYPLLCVCEFGPPSRASTAEAPC